ncbi:translin-associated factor X-interacting protein 1-like [Babylonia areolata]|uniref:translin-associated factor X-interacting protein 1-like n=1 Tax=Babylonia areolata TaxID=304850 RepID=UPI003FD5D4AE
MSDGKLAVARLPPLQGTRRDPYGKNKLESLSGQPYRLNGKVHPLPPPKSLRPYVDTKAGEVDTWPAHASGLALASSSAAMLSRNKSLVIVNEGEEGGGKAPIIPKPRFLEQLQSFLSKELNALGVTDVSPSDLRLQAHREVFEYLIEDFKTYKPLLAAIKNEYEMMLAFQRQQIRQLEPLKQMLVTVSEQCDQKIMGLREDERQEVSNMKAENRRLYAKISAMANEQRDLQEQVNRLQENLREEHQKYRDECDARKLLVADINDLRYQQEDYLASKQTATEEEVAEDPVMLKIALKKARDDEKAASVRLAEMVANYGDVIPRRDFEALEKKYKELEEQSEITQGDFRKLQAEHNALLEVQNQVTGQRDQFYLELANLKRSSTPRPDWEKCGDHVNGGAEHWKEVSEGKSSNELVDVLIQEISAGAGGSEYGGAEYFDGQGTDETVPVYLRFDGPVRNRRLGKRDTLLMIQDVWREKSAADSEKPDDEVRTKMGDFLHTYLQRRFPTPQMVAEWAYNLDDACQRYAAQDDAINLFWNVLVEEADEEIYHEQLRMMHTLLTELTKADVEQGNLGKLDRELFRSTLASALLSIDDEALAAVVQAAETELEEKDMQEVDYKNLFTEDDEGKTGPFLNEVKRWAQQQKEKYIADIKQQLGDASQVTVEEMRQAVMAADQAIDPQDLEWYVMWTFGVDSPEGLAEAQPLDVSRVVERLQNGGLRRGGKKD